VRGRGRSWQRQRPASREEGFVIMTAKASTRVDPLKLVSRLIDCGNVDTVYRDVYLQRARTLLAGVLPVEEFRRIEQQEAELATLPLVIGRAMEKADWPQVKELSERTEALRQAVESGRGQMETAHGVYAVTDVKLDPFSPGLRAFTRLAEKDLAALRTRAVEHLTALELADAPWKGFYGGRRAALQALALTISEQSVTEVASGDPREAAERALRSGDMKGLAKLADALTVAVTPGKRAPGSPRPTARQVPASEKPSTDLLTTYSDDTLKGARRLGLAVRRLESRGELASLRQYAWNPLVADASGRIKVKQVPLPAGTPEGFRERLEMLIIHPLVNSGGARHLPKLVAEDVLVETFPDPKEGEQPPASGVLAALELPGRRGVSRIAIEEALLAHGAGLLQKELGLDPRVFRLVCVPPDVHLRLGEAEGWGRQSFWTHFDGYLIMADGRLRALAGGDVRFGGLYDLLGIGRDYDSDRVMARFAVVRRERMVAW
jgi:hypothetical protein